MGESFNSKNNKLTITNNSTCPVRTSTELTIDTDTYPCLKEFDFKFSHYDYSGVGYSTNISGVLTYSGDPRDGTSSSDTGRINTSEDYYLEPRNQNPADMADMHNYNFNNAKIGQWTITLEPLVKAEA